MFDWLRKSTPCTGIVLFRGTLPPRAEDFVPLRKQGITLKRFPEHPERHWGLKLLHPSWGEADLLARRDFKLPPVQYASYDPCLTKSEQQDIASAGAGLVLRTTVAKQHILRDRKRMLRFSRAVMGNDALAVYDLESNRFWSPRPLDDELTHDADLDVESIYSLHAVTKGQANKTVYWLHTHGLENAGSFNFDIIDPSPDLHGRSNDLLRAMAFAILDKTVTAEEKTFALAHPGGAVRLVPVPEFRRRVNPRLLTESDILTDEHHVADRVVLCEPARGLFGRWSNRVEPNRFLKKEMPDGGIINFSDAATTLMGERAHGTYSVFRRLAEEFAGLDLPCLVKLGYPTDNGAAGGREHLWFQVHTAYESEVEATLLNQPAHVARLKEGDRGTHSVELLTDWTILNPLRAMTPRSTVAAAFLREMKNEAKTSEGDRPRREA